MIADVGFTLCLVQKISLKITIKVQEMLGSLIFMLLVSCSICF